jgi:hypothetical protein
MMIRGDEARENVETTLLDREIMVAAAKLDAAHLDDPHAAALGAEVDRKLLQQHNPMGNRMELQVVLLRRQIVEKNDGTLPAGEEVLQRQDLAPVTQRAVREEAQFGKAVDDHAPSG